MADTGLLVSQILKTSEYVEDDFYRKIITGKLGTNLGMLLENMVAQMLRSSGHELFFHEYSYRPEDSSIEKRCEVDFLIIRSGHVCPIEEKASNYANHHSFDYFVKKYGFWKHERFIVYTKDLMRDDDVTFIPVYMASYL
ncbi:MAG: DUF4143 domain-containing protein [Spirochaetales bacterium]|nr:DUF4143 domain-containing protein [Spirochaetales bacterium]